MKHYLTQTFHNSNKGIKKVIHILTGISKYYQNFVWQICGKGLDYAFECSGNGIAEGIDIIRITEMQRQWNSRRYRYYFIKRPFYIVWNQFGKTHFLSILDG